MTAEELKTLLNHLGAQAEADEGWQRGQWSEGVKQELVRRGRENGYRTCASAIPDDAPAACQPDWGEWLYDLVWLDVPDQMFAVNGLPLVAEIEWGNEGDVWDDFQKLLVARADVRVMVFDECPGLVERLTRQIERFTGSVAGDRYLLASYADYRFTVVEYEVSNLPTF